MAKEKHHLKLSPRAIAILVVFVLTLIIGTYLLAQYMTMGSSAKEIKERRYHQRFDDGVKKGNFFKFPIATIIPTQSNSGGGGG